jgi:hypothetical protein
MLGLVVYSDAPPPDLSDLAFEPVVVDDADNLYLAWVKRGEAMKAAPIIAEEASDAGEVARLAAESERVYARHRVALAGMLAGGSVTALDKAVKVATPSSAPAAGGREDRRDARGVLPHVPDAWIDYTKTKIGYEIPLNRHFYRYEPPRELAVIESEIKALETDIVRLLGGVTA